MAQGPSCFRDVFTHTHTESLNHIAQRAVPFYVTRWRVLVCDLVTSNRMIIEKKGINGFSTNNNRRLHLKMQARGVKHNRTLCVLRQQRKGRGVTMVSTNNNKKSSWKQVRRSDQLRYPIHNRSFIAHGRLWMPCAPALTVQLSFLCWCQILLEISLLLLLVTTVGKTQH